MRTLLLQLQIFTGFTALGLLGLVVINAYHGRHPSRKLTRLTLGFSTAFVVLTLVITGM